MSVFRVLPDVCSVFWVFFEGVRLGQVYAFGLTYFNVDVVPNM